MALHQFNARKYTPISKYINQYHVTPANKSHLSTKAKIPESAVKPHHMHLITSHWGQTHPHGAHCSDEDVLNSDTYVVYRYEDIYAPNCHILF